LFLLWILYGNEKMEGKKERTKKNEREKEFGREASSLNP
jgi:hypothetical protein